jgi:hypothetical protein
MTDHKKTSEVEILKHENHLLQQQDLVGKMLEIEEKRIASLDKKQKLQSYIYSKVMRQTKDNLTFRCSVFKTKMLQEKESII